MRPSAFAVLLGLLLFSTPPLLVVDVSSAASMRHVHIQAFSFASNPTVSPGDSVTWDNHDASGHSVTSDEGRFPSATLDEGATHTVTFTEAGTYAYHCAFHPAMKGRVVVAEPSPAGARLRLSDLSVPSEARVGTAVNVTARLRNDGDADATGTVALVVDGKDLLTRAVLVHAHDGGNVTFAYIPSRAGNVSISMRLLDDPPLPARTLRIVGEPQSPPASAREPAPGWLAVASVAALAAVASRRVR